jgi:signal transduction histidine kinase
MSRRRLFGSAGAAAPGALAAAPGALAAALGALAAALGVLAAAAGHDGLPACLAAAVLGGMLPWHRRAPRVAAAVVVITLLASLVAGELPGTVVVLVGLNAYGVGRYSSGYSRLVAGLLLVVGAEITSGRNSAPYLFLVLGPLLAGAALGQRDKIAAQLAQRGAELDAEREIYSELSVRYERARIAAELHDIVAHAISVMVVQASAGQRLAALDPELTEEAFAAIGAAAKHAEADMGRLVALLTDGGEQIEDADLTLVRELVAQAAATGLNVTLRLEGDRSMTPAAAYRNAYLVVREGLTNALRYASGAAVRVLVRGQPDGLLVEVVNGPAPSSTPLAGHGSGRGLRGLRERLDGHGGQLTAGPSADGGWRLVVTLPQRDVFTP